MTGHISLPGCGAGLGTAGTLVSGAAALGNGAGVGVSAGISTETTGDRDATPAVRGRFRATISKSTPAAPTKIHFGKRCMVARSPRRCGDGAISGGLWRTVTGGADTGVTTGIG